ATYIHQLLVDQSDRLWIGIDAPGLVIFEKGSFRRFFPPNGGLNDRVESICEQPKNTLWFGTRLNGLYRWKAGELTHFGRSEGLATDEISDLQPSKNGGLWIASSKLQHLADANAPVITTVQGVPHDGIFSVYEDREGSVWLCAKER